MWRVVTSAVFGVGLVLGLVSMASEAWAEDGLRPIMTTAILSRHLGSDRDYNEVNPGLGVGVEWTSDRMRFSVEAGGYLNSHAEQSPYLVASAMAPIARSERTGLALHAGVFGGLAHYAGRGDGFRALGVPAVQDWVPVAGVRMGVSLNDRTEWQVGMIPAGKVANMLVTLQVRTVLGN